MKRRRDAAEDRALRRTTLSLAAVLILFCGSGAHCTSRLTAPFYVAAPNAPIVLSPGATLTQVIDAVHANSARVVTLSTNNASISSAGLPRLSGRIAVEAPRRFRLVAGLGLGDTQIDLGSNDDLFWIWSQQSQPPAILFCRHDQFEQSAARRLAPIEPRWLIDALGLVTFRPDEQHTGPTIRPDGRLEVRSSRQSAGGLIEKTAVIDQGTAWVLQQNVYVNGSLAASATASDHRYDAATGVSLPRRIVIQIPGGAPVSSLTVEMGNVVVNQLPGDPTELWSMPQDRGVALINLAEVAPAAGPPVNGAAPMPAVQPGLGYPPQAAAMFSPPMMAPPTAVIPSRSRY
jgi:hypothetical protein